MSAAADSLERSKELLARAVRDFTPVRREKYQTLTPFREQIAELRRKRASCRVIAAVLHAAKVRVSHDTVARFCRDVIGPEAGCPTRRQAAVRKPSAHGRNARRTPSAGTPPPQSIVSRLREQRAAEPSAPVMPVARPRGPRIADPNNV